MSSALTDACISVLEDAGVALEPGLSEEELARVEARFGFGFGPDHRDFLLRVLPVGRSWMDWRSASSEELCERLAWPVEGVLFDVEHSEFWAASWGTKPKEPTEALRRAEEHLGTWPKLIPVHSHRFTPAAPAAPAAPVFSVYQTDVIYYGANLLDYLQREFGPTRSEPAAVTVDVPPWSLLAIGHGGSDL